jgi:hypothetical protein
MSLLDLLAAFLEPIFDLIPRIARRPASNEWMIVDGWVRGVRIRYRPFLHFPIVTHVAYFPSCEIPIDCGIQRVTTADGKSIVINATSRSHLCDLASSHDFDDLVKLVKESVCISDISDDLAEMGLELIAFKVEDLQQVIPIGTV